MWEDYCQSIPLPILSVITEAIYRPALAEGSTTSAALNATTFPEESVMAGAVSPAMASRTTTSDDELKIKLMQWYERRIKETVLKGRNIPSAGAGMAMGLARARAIRDARAKIENCMFAVGEDDELVEKECIGKKSTGDEQNYRIEGKTEKEKLLSDCGVERWKEIINGDERYLYCKIKILIH